MHPGFGDDHAGKGMTDKNRWAILPLEHTLGRSHGLRQRGQGSVHGGDVQSCRLQARNHFGPREPSAKSPCTSTTLRAFSGVAFTAMPRVKINEAAAPVSRVVEKVRLFIVMILFLKPKG